MQRRGAQHEVAADVAGLGAVEQRPDELGIGVVATAAQAVLDGGHAAVMAVRALGDALAHRVVEMLHDGERIKHSSLLWGWRTRSTPSRRRRAARPGRGT